MQNGQVESFQGNLRDECLNVSWFRNLCGAREKVEVGDGNTIRHARI